MAKKKILLLSDDLRMSSGVGTMSREFVLGTAHHYDWVQIGGAIKHPDEGKVVDMASALKKERGIDNGYLKIYPVDGYGNPELLRHLLSVEKPDAILHYTDPRFCEWLYQMEHEVRMNIPIMYYNIWDDLPYPLWNEAYYESSDVIMNISKQTVNIVDRVCQNKPRTDWDNTYIPHGINEDEFFPISEGTKEFKKYTRWIKNVTKDKEYDFVLFYNARNIRRKMVGDLVLAWKEFNDKLTEEQRKKCLLLMHTQPKDPNGTDLPAVVQAVAPNTNVIFSDAKLDTEKLNYLYNLADCGILISSNEGWGLSTTESIMAGTPIIVNVTGGMQDQCGFKLKGEYLTEEHYKEVESLHNYKVWENNKDLTHGEWVKPVWPRTRSLMGSVPTPYIFDDRCDWEDVANRIKEWYDVPRDERKEAGLKGRVWAQNVAGLTGRKMSQRFIEHMDRGFEKWTPRQQYTIYKA